MTLSRASSLRTDAPAGVLPQRAGPPGSARARRAGDQDRRAVLDPAFGRQAHSHRPLEGAACAHVDVLDAGLRVLQLGPLEQPVAALVTARVNFRSRSAGRDVVAMAALPRAQFQGQRQSHGGQRQLDAERAGHAALSFRQWTAARHADQACQPSPRNPAGRPPKRRSQLNGRRQRILGFRVAEDNLFNTAITFEKKASDWSGKRQIRPITTAL